MRMFGVRFADQGRQLTEHRSERFPRTPGRPCGPPSLDPQVLGAPGVPNGVETDHRRHPMAPRRAFDVWGFRGGQGGTRGVSGAVVGGSAA